MIDYSYNEEAARGADKQADRLTDGGAYVGKLTKVYATVSGNKGTHGLVCEFTATSPQQGTAEFTLWTHEADGKAMSTSPGFAFLNSLMFFAGLKKLVPVKGVADVWVDGEGGKRVKEEHEVDTFPELCKEPVGLVLQKELLDNGFRMNLYGVYDPTTRRTMTEVKEGITKAAKLDRLVKGLKDKNGRTKVRRDEAEPGQPGVGADMSD